LVGWTLKRLEMTLVSKIARSPSTILAASKDLRGAAQLSCD